MERDVLEKLSVLSGYLDKDNFQYDSSYFVYSAYDSPLRFTNRYNEVWLELKNQKKE